MKNWLTLDVFSAGRWENLMVYARPLTYLYIHTKKMLVALKAMRSVLGRVACAVEYDSVQAQRRISVPLGKKAFAHIIFLAKRMFLPTG